MKESNLALKNFFSSPIFNIRKTSNIYYLPSLKIIIIKKYLKTLLKSHEEVDNNVSKFAIGDALFSFVFNTENIRRKEKV